MANRETQRTDMFDLSGGKFPIENFGTKIFQIRYDIRP